MNHINKLTEIFFKHAITPDSCPGFALKPVLRDSVIYDDVKVDEFGDPIGRKPIENPDIAALQYTLETTGSVNLLAKPHSSNHFSFDIGNGDSVTAILELHKDPVTGIASITGMLESCTITDLTRTIMPLCIEAINRINIKNKNYKKRTIKVNDVRLYCPYIYGDPAGLYSGPIHYIFGKNLDTVVISIVSKLLKEKPDERIQIFAKSTEDVDWLLRNLYLAIFAPHSQQVVAPQMLINDTLSNFVPNLKVEVHDGIGIPKITDDRHWFFMTEINKHEQNVLLDISTKLNHIVSWGCKQTTLHVDLGEMDSLTDPASVIDTLQSAFIKSGNEEKDV